MCYQLYRDKKRSLNRMMLMHPIDEGTEIVVVIVIIIVIVIDIEYIILPGKDSTMTCTTF